MIFPLKQWETARRGYRFGQKVNYTDHHLGVDHIVPEGTPIYAPVDCEIINAKQGKQGGNQTYVRFKDVEYGMLIMRCMHLKDLSFPVGSYKEGEVIGYTGNTGKLSTCPHLHTDISKEKVQINNFNNFIDPEKYFAACVDREKNMYIYKKEGEGRMYALVGNVLVPLAISLQTYAGEFTGIETKILNEEEFKKYKISDKVQITEL